MKREFKSCFLYHLILCVALRFTVKTKTKYTVYKLRHFSEYKQTNYLQRIIFREM